MAIVDETTEQSRMKKYVCDLDLGVGIHCKRKWLDEWRKLVTLSLNEMTQPNNGFSSNQNLAKKIA